MSADADYAWPLGRPAPLSGGFGECREGHFHTGIDFSTGGRSGLPVHAVADGEIYRLVDGLTGFGKAVYVRHADGNISVYGHLESFSPAIGKVVSSLRTGMAFRDKLDTGINPGRLPVRRGELVGFNGESGAGLPHLHFELRRAEEYPIDPFPFWPSYTDTAPARILAIELIPLSEYSLLNGQPARGRNRIEIASDSADFISRPEISGRWWMNLLITDPTVDRHTVSPRKVSYSMDGGTWKNIEFDSLSYRNQENKRVGLLYDLISSSGGNYSLRLLTSIPRPPAPLADTSYPLDADNLADGEHSIRILANDWGNNSSVAEFRFRVKRNSPSRRNPSGHSFAASGEFIANALLLIPPDEGETVFTLADGQTECVVPAAAFLTSDRVYFGEKSMTGKPPLESTCSRSRLWGFFPDGVPANRPMTLRAVLPFAPGMDPRKFGAYRFNPLTGAWSFIGGIFDTPTGRISVSIDRLAAYAVFDDSVPPVITWPKDQKYPAAGEIRIPVSDRGSGIADTGLVLFDGKPHAEWYYDSDRGWVRVYPRGLLRGRHRLTLMMSDRQGNIVQKDWRVMIR